MKYALSNSLASAVSGLDPDAKAYIIANSITDPLAISYISGTCKNLKKHGMWATLEDAYFFGSDFQPSATTLKSLKLINDATGTMSQGTLDGTFNSSGHGFIFTNSNAGTSITGKTYIALIKDNPNAARNTLISSRLPAPNEGFGLNISGASGMTTGPTTINDIYARGSTNGTTIVGNRSLQGSNQDWTWCAATYDGSNVSAFSSWGSPASIPAPTLWNNNPTVGIGKLTNSADPYTGRMFFAASLSSGITSTTFNAFKVDMEKLLSSTIPFFPAVIFEGNSLTIGGAGGSNWPTKLLSKSGWNDPDIKTQNYAQNGQEQTVEIEPRLTTIINTWAPYGTEDRLLFLWSGTNDITASKSAADIIASLERYLIAAKAARFRMVILTITNAGSWGAGPKKTVQNTVNNWILTTGASIADQALNLDIIGATYPAFLDPNDSTYYADSTHHNDAGRVLIADFVAANVNAPTYTPF